jgi:hypothetical protein
MLEYVRVRRLDGQELVIECRTSRPDEGTIGTEVEWKNFLGSLPRHGKKSKPVALVTMAEDLEFQHPVNAQDLLGYNFSEAVDWLSRLAKPRQTLDDTAGHTKWGQPMPRQSHTTQTGA